MKTIFCALRKKHLSYTPEEVVRQKTIQWLNQIHLIPLDMMEIEPSVSQFSSSSKDRIDLLVYRLDEKKSLQPWLLVECKKPQALKMDSWWDQVARYLKWVNPQYLMGTDGSQLFLWEKQEDKWHPCTEFPQWKKS